MSGCGTVVSKCRNRTFLYLLPRQDATNILAQHNILCAQYTSCGSTSKASIFSTLPPSEPVVCQIDRNNLRITVRDQGIFKQPKTAKEAHAKLQLHYPCDLNRVEVALLRLQKRKQLRKASKGTGDKKQVAYVW